MKTVTYHGDADRLATGHPPTPHIRRGESRSLPNDVADRLARKSTVTVHESEEQTDGA